jgi:ectoine hydroxylase-related dioxygenase (phytanoyl-CoA dioxygenase family)
MVDPAAEQALATEGFVVRPFLPADAVAELLASHPRRPLTDTITTDYMDPDRAVMAATREAVAPILAAHLPGLLVDHELVMATFVAKYPGHMSSMFLHDDRTYVDERRARAVTVWIPLSDVSPEAGNGTLELVPRSHRLDRGWAGSNTPDLVRPYERFLRDRLVPVTAEAGTAVVYDTRTLHASAANATDQLRIALACAVAPRGEPLVHVVARGRTIRVHRVTPAFFVDHHPRDIEVEMPADCPVVDEFEDRAELRPEDVAAVYGETPSVDPVVPDAVFRPGDPDTLPWLPYEDTPSRSGRVQRLVRLAPGERRELQEPPGRVVRAVDGPPVGAGVRTATAAADLVPGRAVELGDEPVTMWNEGPVDLVVEVVAPRRLRLRRGRSGRPRAARVPTPDPRR